MKITVTATHIAAATPHSNSSPIALALRELGYLDATVTHRYAYFGEDVYELPEVASANEIRFDFLAKRGAIQGETVETVEPYEFELGEKVNV